VCTHPISVEHRVRQLEEWLAAALKNFKLHQEGLISRIPKLVRSVTMGDFADKYNGDIQACLRGLQRERMGEVEAIEIDRETRKRKWAAALEETEASGSGTANHDSESSRALKNGVWYLDRVYLLIERKPFQHAWQLPLQRRRGVPRTLSQLTRPERCV